MLSIIKSYLFSLLLVFTCVSYADNKIEHKIAVIVNEEIITSYDIIQRMKLSALLQGIDINEQNNQLLINNTVDELINEKLKKEKIKEYDISVNKEEYLEFEIDFIQRNNIEKNIIINLLEINGLNYSELKNLLEIELSWTKLINGLYLRLTSVSNAEINEMIGKNPSLTSEQAESFVIQRQLELKSSKVLRDMINESTIEYK